MISSSRKSRRESRVTQLTRTCAKGGRGLLVRHFSKEAKTTRRPNQNSVRRRRNNHHGRYTVSKNGSTFTIPNLLDSSSTSRANLCIRSLQRGPERSIYPLHRMIDKGKDKTPAIYTRNAIPSASICNASVKGKHLSISCHCLGLIVRVCGMRSTFR